MKATAVAILALLAAPAMADRQVFAAWKSVNNKAYPTQDEESLRYAIFAANLARVNAHNAKSESWSMAINEFGDLTPNEFASARIGGYKPRKLRRSNPDALIVAKPDVSLPSSVDWTTKGAVTPVKNQGQCGSCWAFSTTGSTEGINAINGKGLKSLSEQQLVDCSGAYGNQGCNGGLMDDAFQYIIANGGLCSESAYPYTAQDGTCQTSCTKVTQIAGYKDVTPDNDIAFATAVAQQPVSIAIEADQSSFQFYSSGVLTAACGTALDHGVLTVGYGTTGGVQYFKVKNSWGASWGMSGYILLARGTSYNGGAGQCGIYSEPSYPTQ